MGRIHEVIQTNDGFTIDTEIYYPNINSEKIVILCHGMMSTSRYGKNKQFIKLISRLLENNYKVIAFNWRGHGESSGNSLDVSLDSFYYDLSAIVDTFVNNEEIYFIGHSFGALAINLFIYRRKYTNVQKIVLTSPPLNPIDSSLLNENTFLFDEITSALNNGSLEKVGYVKLKNNNWKISKKLIDDCKEYNYKDSISYLSGKTLIIQGNNDIFVDKTYNEEYSTIYDIDYKEYNASHSLCEVFDDVINDIIEYFAK